jgi:hypothetical protein
VARNRPARKRAQTGARVAAARKQLERAARLGAVGGFGLLDVQLERTRQRPE